MERVILEKWYWETFDGRNGGNARDGVFERYYDHLQRALLRGLNDLESTREAAMPELSEELTEAYLGQMKRITLRALLLEMEICEEEGSLKGVNGQEKYACFEESFLGNPEYLREVYDAYPLMYEGMLRTLGDFVRNIEEVLKRFAEDREGINSRFFQENPCRNIRRIGGGGSDAHRQGRRVFILEMDNGEKLVYKPRSLAIDERYTAFLGWIFRGLGMPFWWNCAWDRGNYGWCQWVSGSACRSREELQRYYYRNGILLCVSYLLGSEDIHYENLIACGEYPVIVDLEMIVGSRGMGQERYIRELVQGVFAHGPELDDCISRYSVGWSFARIPRMAAAVMRTAMYEVLYMSDIPNAAAINEAVEIAKKYEPAEVVSFLNGILGTFVRTECEDAPPKPEKKAPEESPKEET